MLQVNMDNNARKMPDTAQVKIENLQKVCEDYSEQKRQRVDEDNSTTYNTVELYGDNEYHATQDAPMPTIEEKIKMNRLWLTHQ